ncbi:hypothetical protein DRW03_02560 [Corallococcus sp. H22C18031201]|nr:hypothetical protein DRW03_02560 [Corallococcus sp. H22C18031201]
MKTVRIVAASLLVGTLAFARSEKRLELSAPAFNVTAEVTPRNISSPELQLDLSPSAVRGQAYGQPVDLKAAGSRIQGRTGKGPVDLKLQKEPESVAANGTFGGKPSHLTLSPEELIGNVGACSYDLIAHDKHEYIGWRECADRRESPVKLIIPETLDRAPEAQRIAALSVLLSK